MAYNNYNYNPYSYSLPNQNNYLNRPYTNQQTQLPQQQQFSQNNIIWVKGKQNARSMQVPPNSTVILLDSEVGKFYIKTTDDIGLGRLRVFSYVEEPNEERESSSSSSSLSNLDLSNYVTKDQLAEMIKEIKKQNEQFVSTVEPKQSRQYNTINKQF